MTTSATLRPPWKILLVEDDSEIRIAISDFLLAQDFLVTSCETAGEVATAISGHCFDAVIADVSVSDANGVTVVEKIWRAYKRLPLLVVSGSGFYALREIQTLSFDGFMPKPFSLGELLVRLRMILEQKYSSGVNLSD